MRPPTLRHSLTEINRATHNFKHAHTQFGGLGTLPWFQPKTTEMKSYPSSHFWNYHHPGVGVCEFPRIFKQYPFLPQKRCGCCWSSLARWLKTGQGKATGTASPRQYFCSLKTLPWSLASSCHVSTNLPTSCPKPNRTDWKTPIAFEKIWIKLLKPLTCVHFSSGYLHPN